MNKRQRKKQLKTLGLDSISSQDLFTELMKRVPQSKRFCLFIQIKQKTYEDRDDDTIYSLYQDSDDVLILTKPIKVL